LRSASPLAKAGPTLFTPRPAMTGSAVIMFLLLIAVMAGLNRFEFGRFD
jgi:hypothetical protein